MRKQRDQWQLHQSQNWRGEIYSQTSATASESHILIKTIIVENLPRTQRTRLHRNS